MGLNIREAANKLGMSSATIRRWIRNGRLEAELINGPYGQQYKISEEALERAKEQENTPVIIHNTATQEQLQHSIQQIVSSVISEELEPIKNELQSTREELQKVREQDRQIHEKRDKQLLMLIREMQEMQKERSLPWYKKIFRG